jgi:hypothetical protein
MSTTSSGNTRTVAPAPAAHEALRRGAALKALESAHSSAGNAIANLAGHAPSNEQKVGDVKPPGGEPADENTGKAEPVPQQMSKDRVGWGRAAEAARKLAR